MTAKIAPATETMNHRLRTNENLRCGVVVLAGFSRVTTDDMARIFSAGLGSWSPPCLGDPIRRKMFPTSDSCDAFASRGGRIPCSREHNFGRGDGMIIALAGRRIDARDSASRRFPPENITMVRERLGMLFKAQQAEVLISSAACGADLLALEEAGAQGMRRRIVLPFSAERFRTTS